MVKPRTVAAPWSIAGNTARLQTASLAGRIELLYPDQGLGDLQLSGESLVGTILAVRRQFPAAVSSPPVDGQRTRQPPEWAVADKYVRGHDVVATYAASDDWPYLTQIYWHASQSSDASAALGSVSLLVSLQTPLLDSWPEVLIESQLAAEEVLCVTCDAEHRVNVQEVNHADFLLATSMSTTCIVWRLHGRGISFLETVPAGDARELSLRRVGGDLWHSRWELFADFLEKGVIRRARLESQFVARTQDLELARAICQSIGEQPLPLTT